MFQLTKPRREELANAIAAVCAEEPPLSNLLSLADGLTDRSLGAGFVHDRLRTRIGEGADAFAVARRAFRSWEQFDLGWVRAANSEIPVADGEIIAVEVRAFGLWSVNLSRILETIDTEDRFGFLYCTTAHHAEEGEERFLLEFERTDGGVWYCLEAVSRPRHPLAWLGYPFTRALQHRFARDSHRRMRRAVGEPLEAAPTSNRQKGPGIQGTHE